MYGDFSNFYDRLTDDVGYKKRTEYLLELFGKFDRRPTLLLDLACGTGGFSNCFAKSGIQVIGVDISPDMLCKARENSLALGLDVLYLCQDMTELDLFGTVDGAVCCLDSLNHLTDYEDLCAAISKVSLFLEKDRLFIFDVNSVYKHREVLGNNTFVSDEEDIYLVWQNGYDEAEKTVDISLDFFERCGEDCYDRTTEYIKERAYTESELCSALKRAGLEIVGVFGDMGVLPPSENEERLIYVTRKV